MNLDPAAQVYTDKDSPFISGLSFSRAVDERVNINKPRSYTVLQGASNLVNWVLPASTNLNTSNISFSIQTTKQQILARHMQVRYYVNIAFTGTGNPLLDLTAKDALRSYPIATNTQTATLTVGNESFSVQPIDFIQALARYGDYDYANYNASQFPSMPDQFQAYSDYATYGTGRNPLALYGENSAQDTRGGFPMTVVSNGNGSAELKMVITEPLFISPLMWSGGDAPGIVGVESVRVQLQPSLNSSSFSRVWSHASNGNTLSGITVTFYNPPELLYTIVMPNESSIKYEISKTYFYPYYNLDTTMKSAALSISAGSTSTINSNQVTLGGVPEKVYIFARRQDSDQTYLTSDVFAAIESIDITFNTQTGILSNATSQDLYSISVRNGLKSSWSQFSQYCGAVLCLQFGTDIPLPGNEAPGSSSAFQFKITASVRNPSAASVSYVLYAIMQYPGVMSINNGLVGKANYVINPSQIQQVNLDPNTDLVKHQRYAANEVMGGSIFGDIFSGLKNATRSVASAVAPMLRQGVQYGRAALPYLAAAAPLIAQWAGKDDKDGGAMSGGRRKKRGGYLTGGYLTGGSKHDNIVQYQAQPYSFDPLNHSTVYYDEGNYVDDDEDNFNEKRQNRSRIISRSELRKTLR